MTDANGTAVAAAGVAFAYGERQALRGVDFTVARGAVHGFLGPNGSGKSTLFKLLATILPLRHGRATVLGLDLATQIAALRPKLGVVFQAPALDRKLSVRRNLVYGGHLYGFSGADLDRRVDAMLEQGNLADRANDAVGELSGGLRRRVELAKGLLHEPELVLLDEPSTGLDPGARQDLWSFLRARESTTVLFTTHLMDEADGADRITLLHEGAIVADEAPGALKRALGGEVLDVEARDPAAIETWLRDAGVTPQRLGESVRVESGAAHGLVAELMQTHGDGITRVTLSHPSLEDVFVHHTGRRFWADGDAEGAA